MRRCGAFVRQPATVRCSCLELTRCAVLSCVLALAVRLRRRSRSRRRRPSHLPHVHSSSTQPARRHSTHPHARLSPVFLPVPPDLSHLPTVSPRLTRHSSQTPRASRSPSSSSAAVPGLSCSARFPKSRRCHVEYLCCGMGVLARVSSVWMSTQLSGLVPTRALCASVAAWLGAGVGKSWVHADSEAGFDFLRRVWCVEWNELRKI